MLNWFTAGGFGMLLVSVVGLGMLAAAARAVLAPSEARVNFLRAVPSLLLGLALFASGFNLWTVYLHIQGAPSEAIALIGMLEAAQPLTLAGVLIAAVSVMRMSAEARIVRSN
jgi:uncharacterized protein YybS (DUF2232 family)